LFKYLIYALLESSELTPDQREWLAVATNRSSEYLMRIERSVSDDLFETLSRDPQTRHSKSVDTSGIEAFLLEKSKLSADGGHRILDVHVGVNIKCITGVEQVR